MNEAIVKHINLPHELTENSYLFDQLDVVLRNRFHFLKISIESVDAQSYILRVDVDDALVKILFAHTSHALSAQVKPIGFSKEAIPLSYVEKNYYNTIISHIKEFLIRFLVYDFVFFEIRRQKLPLISEMRLVKSECSTQAPTYFVLELIKTDTIHFIEWKMLCFKAPRRKNYKDLDRQAEGFCAQELRFKESYSVAKGIQLNDWVLFSLTLCDVDQQVIEPHMSNALWFFLGNEEFESPLRELFYGKHVGDSFVTNNVGLLDYFSSFIHNNYFFKVDIIDVIPYAYVCFDLMRHHFKIKTNKDLHKKIIEVFSFRNDISQRRSMVEEALSLLIAKHKITIPDALVARQENSVLAGIRENPDYNVYRRQRDFDLRVQELARRQLQETVLVDQLAMHENITVSHEDVKAYINLTKRARTRDFLHFAIPYAYHDGFQIPIAYEQIQIACLREKTINYIIYHLTKK